MSLKGKKVAVLFERDFYESEIFYYQHRFPEEEIELHFLTRLWGLEKITFTGHDYNVPMDCNESFENHAPGDFDAIIVPSGIVADRLRYTEDITKLPPATEFMVKAFKNKNVIKGIICHGMWLMAPAADVVRSRKAVVHNNLLGDAKNMGIEYVNEDMVVDGDLVTARTGGHCHLLAKQIIKMLDEK